MNTMDRLLGTANYTDSLAIDADKPTEAELKAERINWHRRNATTGPFKLAHVSNGRLVSQERRRAKAAKRKMNTRRRKAFMIDQALRSSLRGQLETVGALTPATGPVVRSDDHVFAVRELLGKRYGSVDGALAAYQGRA